MKWCISSLLKIFCGLLLVTPCWGIGPQDVFLVTNKNVPESRPLAEHYCGKRGIPLEHILDLDLPPGDDISRLDYDAKIASPIHEWLQPRREQAKVLLMMYGVPLRVGGQSPSPDEKAQLDKVQAELTPLEKQRQDLENAMKDLEVKTKNDPASKETQEELDRRKQEIDKLRKQLRPLEEQKRFLSYQESHAAVDSELALLWWDNHELRRFHPNPLYFQVEAEQRQNQPPVLMTCRLDGPNPEQVRRMIDQSVEIEAKGLEGKVYVDARGIAFQPRDGGHGYGGYDQGMRDMARLLESEGKMSVTLDDKPELFAPGACTECALYCGWYSHANFVDCCRFAPGAIAWHLASSEAVSLHDPNSKLWCKNLLQNGAVATLGPVAEPYTIGFPKPAEFFGSVATGQFTLVESYWRTQLFASWMTILIGDPLYNPYAKNPRLKVEQVQPSPAGTGMPRRGRQRD